MHLLCSHKNFHQLASSAGMSVYTTFCNYPYAFHSFLLIFYVCNVFLEIINHYSGVNLQSFIFFCNNLIAIAIEVVLVGITNLVCGSNVACQRTIMTT